MVYYKDFMGLFLDTAWAATRAAKKVVEDGEGAPSGLVSKIAEMIGFFFTRLPSWIAAGIVFVLSIGAAKIVRKIVETRIAEKIDEEHQEILLLAGRISYVSTLAVGITVSLKIAGIDLTTILAAVAFGIGFALRDLIMNFIAGVMILISRHFTIGDFIRVGDRIGKVIEIQSRATILKAIDGTKVIVPNAEIFSSSVVSYTSNPMRRVIVPLYVAYGTDLDYAIKIALRVLKKHPKILKKPQPSVIIKDYGDSSIDLMSRFWVLTKDGWVRVRSEIIKLMDQAFTEAGIRVPYEVLHLETSSDTSEEEKEGAEHEKSMKEKLALLKIKKALVPTPAPSPNGGNGNGQIAPAASAPVAAAHVAATPAILAPNVLAPVALAVPAEAVGAPAAEMPQAPMQAMEPEGAYQDQADIDDNSIDNIG